MLGSMDLGQLRSLYIHGYRLRSQSLQFIPDNNSVYSILNRSEDINMVAFICLGC